MRRGTRLNRLHTDGRFAVERAFIFADPAADAEIAFDVRLPDPDPFAMWIVGFNLIPMDRLFRDGTMFFTDKAFLALGVRQTPADIEVRNPNNGSVFVVNIQKFNSAGGTDMSAQVAVVFAATDARDQAGGENPVDAALK